MFIRLGKNIINLDKVISIKKTQDDMIEIKYINNSKIMFDNFIVENNKDLYDTIFEILMNHKMVMI